MLRQIHYNCLAVVVNVTPQRFTPANLTYRGKLSHKTILAVDLSKRFNIMWKVLSRLNFLSPALDIIWHRCERYDGTGHPFGVKGINIPLGSRILAVADIFDGMTSGRASRQVLAPEVAVQKLVAESGRHFDPDVVNAFLRVWRKTEFQVVPTRPKWEKTS